MALILSIETSEKICSVALGDGYNIIGYKESREEKAHASKLTILIEELFKEKGLQYTQLSAVAVSKGPGSYTGLRIGVSAAKGICYALNIPLISIGTLNSLCWGLLNSSTYRELCHYTTDDCIMCPMIDARRMEVYRAMFNNKGEMISKVESEIITELSFSEIMQNKPVVFFGSGAEKCKQVFSSKNALFVNTILPHASFMVSPAYDAYNAKQFEDVAYFEPFYLKDFIATIPKKLKYA